MSNQAYPSDISDEEWAFVAPYLVLMNEDAPQRKYPLRGLFNALRYWSRTGCGWRYLPHDLPPWATVYQQWTRWRDARCLEAMTADLREIVRLIEGRSPTPTASIVDSRTLQSTPESGSRAGYDGGKRRKGSKAHIAVDTLGNLLSVCISPANEQDRQHLETVLAAAQETTGGTLVVNWADQGYTGAEALAAAERQDIELLLVKRPTDAKGFVLLPRRWVVERTFGWQARFRRLSRDYERLASSLKQLHFLVTTVLLGARLAKFIKEIVAGMGDF